MSHLEEGVLHAMLDGEVASTDLKTIQVHLNGCPACTAKFDEARRLRDEAFGMITALDGVPAGLAMAAASFAAPAPAPLTHEPSRRKRVRAWAPPAAWAATIVAALGLGWSLLADRQAMPLPEARADQAPAAVAPPTVGAAAEPADLAQRTATPPKNEQPRQRKPAKEPATSAPPPTPTATSVVRDSALGARRSAEELAVAPAAPRLEGELKKDALKRANSIADRRSALDEVVVAKAAVPSISADQAIETLGGSLRLIDGLTPARFERAGDLIRVVYETRFGRLILEQWRAANVVSHRLIAPTGAPSDTVSAWTERIR